MVVVHNPTLVEDGRIANGDRNARDPLPKVGRQGLSIEPPERRSFATAEGMIDHGRRAHRRARGVAESAQYIVPTAPRFAVDRDDHRLDDRRPEPRILDE